MRRLLPRERRRKADPSEPRRHVDVNEFLPERDADIPGLSAPLSDGRVSVSAGYLLVTTWLHTPVDGVCSGRTAAGNKTLSVRKASCGRSSCSSAKSSFY